jgi:hypothetical protein
MVRVDAGIVADMREPGQQFSTKTRNNHIKIHVINIIIHVVSIEAVVESFRAVGVLRHACGIVEINSLDRAAMQKGKRHR